MILTSVRIHYINGVVLHKSKLKADMAFSTGEQLEAYRKELKEKYEAKKTIYGKPFDRVEILFDLKC